MIDHVITIAIAVLSSTAISAVIVKLLDRDKQKAEVKSAGVHDDVQIGQLGLEYAKAFKEEIDKLKKLNDDLEHENKRLSDIVDNLDKRIEHLTEENNKLKIEIQKIKGKM